VQPCCWAVERLTGKEKKRPLFGEEPILLFHFMIVKQNERRERWFLILYVFSLLSLDLSPTAQGYTSGPYRLLLGGLCVVGVS